MTGPLVDPLPWTHVERVERDLTTEMRDRLRERFQVAQELILLRDTLRERALAGEDVSGTGNLAPTQRIKELEDRFDELDPDKVVARLRHEVRAAGLAALFPGLVDA